MATKTPAKKAAKPTKPAPKAEKKVAPKTAKETTKLTKPVAKAETKVPVKKETTAKLPAKPKPVAKTEMKLGKVAKAKKPELVPVKRAIEEVKPFEKKETPRAPVKPPVTAIFSNKVTRKESTREAIDSISEKMAQAAMRTLSAPIEEEKHEKPANVADVVTVMEKADVRRPAANKKREVAEGRISFEEAMRAASSQTSSQSFFDVQNYLRK